MKFHYLRRVTGQSDLQPRQQAKEWRSLSDCFMDPSQRSAEQMKRSNLMVHYGDSDIVLCTNTFPVPRSSLKAPFFVLSAYTATLSGCLRLFVESICKNVPLKGKHNIIMQAARRHTQLHI